MKLIEIRLRELGQLFNSLDPTPFHHQDLDPDAEAFIVGWASEQPTDAALGLVVHLANAPADTDIETRVTEAIHNYFDYRVEMTTRDLRQLMRRGRVSLLIGLAFLAACLLAADLIARTESGALTNIIKESLTIGGWVAMWRPLEIFLYDWWPITRLRRTLRKLSTAPVRLSISAAAR